MTFCLASLCVLAVGGLLALLSSRLGLVGALAGGLLGLAGALPALVAPPAAYQLSWTIPYGSFSLWLDPLAAYFLVLVLLVSLPISVYAGPYLEHHLRGHGRSSGPSWLFYNVFLAFMMLVVLAHDGVLFLLAWEGMTLASYFLVNTDHQSPQVRQAANLYLICSQIGVSCLLGLFLTVGFDFSAWAFPSSNAVLFWLALVGFGLKLGLMPLHVWLPEAHPAAPSPVSAAMSAIMVKMGLYGLLRSLSLVSGPLPPWWGWVLLLLGLASALYGVTFALAQNQLKRLLAYSTIENVGLLIAGVGLATLARAHGELALAALALGAVLWHALSHALGKCLLFLGAGNVLEAAGTGNLNQLGGLLKRMPHTGAATWAGCLTMMALPPGCGFFGELLLGLAGFQSLLAPAQSLQIAGLLLLVVLPLVTGLAIVVFTKLFGLAWLGEPRQAGARAASEQPWGSLHLLAWLCLGLGLAAPWVLGGFPPILVGLAPELGSALSLAWPPVVRAATWADGAGCGLLLLVALVAGLRAWLLRGRERGTSPTWDCGYTRPAVTMQYTGSSYTQPLVLLFRGLLGSRRLPAASGLFPETYAVGGEVPDACTERFYGPVSRIIFRLSSPLRRLQHGNLQIYVLYILVALAISWVALEASAP